MSQLILNDRTVELPDDDVNLLDFLREAGLTAAKPGCRGGDCGACQVLLGELAPGESQPQYRTVNTCLLTTGLVAGCHLITTEGLNADELTPVQQALVTSGGVQCGYCTPGLVVAMTGALLAGGTTMAAVDGNLCRCTGYAGVRRACATLDDAFPRAPRTLAEAADLGLLPARIAAAGSGLAPLTVEPLAPVAGQQVLAGETDWSVNTRGSRAAHGRWLLLSRVPSLRGITAGDGTLTIGAAVTVAELKDSPLVATEWPALPVFLDMFASPAIRHVATAGGNLVNASPVADLTVVLLALGAQLTIDGPDGPRQLPLEGFYHGYKQTDLGPGELLVSIQIPDGAGGTRRLHAEKVSKRVHDDIAAVNSAMVVDGGDPERFGDVRLSAGGVAPVPLLLTRVADRLSGRPVDAGTVREALAVLDDSIAPIDDVRGSARYKAGLLRHLILAHLGDLYPGFDASEVLR